MDHLSRLENRSVYILREAFKKFKNLAMLWSIGKDSTVMLWLARKAFLGHVPFPLVHVDTTFKIPSMIEFRDRLCADWKLKLIVGKNTAALEEKRTFPDGNLTRVECCSLLKKDALKHVLDEHGFTGVIVGVRRDEEPTRAKERYFSPRNANMEWDAEDQPPELWDQFNTDFEDQPGDRITFLDLDLQQALQAKNARELEDLRVGQDFGERSTGDDPSLAHHHHRIGDLLNLRHRVTNVEHR